MPPTKTRMDATSNCGLARLIENGRLCSGMAINDTRHLIVL